MNFCMIQQQRSVLQLAGTLYEPRPGHRGFSQWRQTPRQYLLQFGPDKFTSFRIRRTQTSYHPTLQLCKCATVFEMTHELQAGLHSQNYARAHARWRHRRYSFNSTYHTATASNSLFQMLVAYSPETHLITIHTPLVSQTVTVCGVSTPKYGDRQ